MTCTRIYDFIGGTTIRLPRPGGAQSARREVWDILRPNRSAAGLVARHMELLVAMKRSVPAAPVQTSPLS